MDLYRALGVGADASVDEVRRAFRSLALLYHPDKTAALEEHARLEAVAKFSMAKEAYERLKTEEGREAYARARG